MLGLVSSLEASNHLNINRGECQCTQLYTFIITAPFLFIAKRNPIATLLKPAPW
jgi:hypothetical protein